MGAASTWGFTVDGQNTVLDVDVATVAQDEFFLLPT